MATINNLGHEYLLPKYSVRKIRINLAVNTDEGLQASLDLIERYLRNPRTWSKCSILQFAIRTPEGAILLDFDSRFYGNNLASDGEVHWSCFGGIEEEYSVIQRLFEMLCNISKCSPVRFD